MAYGSDCSPTIANNVIAYNSTSGKGGGIFCTNSSTPAIINNIIVNNTTSSGGGIQDDSSPNISYNDVWGNSSNYGGDASPGIGDISADPLFVDPDNDDYHLGDYSPCIGAGTSGPEVPDTDMDGNPRPNPPGSNPDMGAYESLRDTPLPVELSTFTAAAGDGEVTLHWVTESETDNLGFHVYRALSEDGEYRQLTAELIAGAGNTTTEQTYSFTDIRLTNGVTYWYKLEDVAFDGTRTMHGPIAVTPQAKEEVLAPVVVEVSSFTAQAEGEQVTLQWSAEGETANLGFLVYRASEENGVYERLTQEVITSTGGQAYVFTDSELPQSGTYWYMLEGVSSDGIWTKHGPISVTVQAQVEVVVSLPERYALSLCYPNPFNPSTTIRYELSEGGKVKLTICDLLGQEIRLLVSETQPAGWYRVSWDGKDGAGHRVSSGVYLYRLEVEDEFWHTRKMVLVR